MGELIENTNRADIKGGPNIREVVRDAEDMTAMIMQCVDISSIMDNLNKGTEYVVQIPLKYQKAFEEGKVLLNQNATTDVIYPMLYEKLENGKRHFVAQLPIKEQSRLAGNPVQDIAQAYQNMYMQQAVHEMAEMLSKTYSAVQRIEQGQMDDRIAILTSGRDLIANAMKGSEEGRIADIEQGRAQISIAQHQILQTLRTKAATFTLVEKSKWKRFGMLLTNGDYCRERDKEYSDIQQYYSLYLQATNMLAASYMLVGGREKAENVFETAIDEIRSIDWSGVRTIEYIHPNEKNFFYLRADNYIASEELEVLEDPAFSDRVELEMDGEKILEAFHHDEQ